MEIPHSYSCCFLKSAIHEDFLFCLLLPLLCMGVETLSLINAPLTKSSICFFQTASSPLLDLGLQLPSWEYQAPPWGAGRMWGDLESCPWSAPLRSQGTETLTRAKTVLEEGRKKTGGRDPKYLIGWKTTSSGNKKSGVCGSIRFYFLKPLEDNFMLFSMGLNRVWN